MKLDYIIDRFDDTIYDDLLGGKNVLKIIRAIDNKDSNPDKFPEILRRLYPTDQEIIENDRIRRYIIDVLSTKEIEDLANSLNIEHENLYSKIKSLSIKKDQVRKALFDFFDIEYTQIPKAKKPNFDCQIDCQYPLFSHQRRAIQEITTIFQKKDRILLHMPTGSGKTRTATNLICEHMRLNEPTVIIWLANAEELCEQTYNEITKGWKKLGNRKLNLIKFYGSSKVNISLINDGIIIASLQKLNALLTRDSYPITSVASKTSLVVIDEAHIAVAETYKDIMEILVNVGNINTKLLGLSATPGRTWNDLNEDKKLAKLFNKNKVILKVEGYDNPVDYLVSAGYLAKVNNYPLYYEGKSDITDEEINNIKNHLRLSNCLIESLSKDNYRNIAIVNKIKTLVDRHKRIIVFALTVEHSILLATSLQLLGIEAFSVTTSSSNSERKRIIERYKSKEKKSIVLCNYGILTTGFDAPKTSCAVITRPTDSLVLYSQMVGRAIRGTKAKGNKEAEIITVIDRELPGFENVASAFFNWEDIWN